MTNEIGGWGESLFSTVTVHHTYSLQQDRLFFNLHHGLAFLSFQRDGQRMTQYSVPCQTEGVHHRYNDKLTIQSNRS